MRSVLLPAGLLVLACSPGSTPAASDAIPITFSDSVADIELLPELVIGDAESDVYFHAIQDVAVDEDGGIYVSDRAREGIHVFDASGRLVRRIGTQGQGPGEFQLPFHIAVTRDTLFVHHDTGLLSMFDVQGEFLGLVRAGPALGYAMSMEHTPSGIALVGQADSMHGRWYMSRTTMSLRIFDYTTGEVSDAIWQLPLSPLRDIGNGAMAADIGAPYPSMSASPNGRIFGTRGDAYTIEVRSAEGSVLERANAVVPRVRVSDVDVRLALERRAGAGAGDGRAPERSRYRAPLGNLFADRHGNLIVERRDLRRDTMRVWDFIDDGWHVRGRLRTPPSLRMRRFDGCNLYGVVTDSSGVGAVVRFGMKPCPLDQ